MPAIVLEGPEKAGKSTLAKELLLRAVDSKQWRNVSYVHHIHGDSIPTIIEKETKLYTESKDTLFIVDRWYSSEFVYTELTGRVSTMQAMSIHVAEKWFSSKVSVNGILCMLYADIKTLKNRRDDSDIDVDPKDEVLAYKKICDTANKWIHLNTDVERPPEIAKQLLSVLY